MPLQNKQLEYPWNATPAVASENGKVSPPKRVANSARRSREHLTPDEVDRMVSAAAQTGRHGMRDAAMVLTAYRHGLRVSELIGLRWDAVDLAARQLHVNRLKSG